MFFYAMYSVYWFCSIIVFPWSWGPGDHPARHTAVCLTVRFFFFLLLLFLQSFRATQWPFLLLLFFFVFCLVVLVSPHLPSLFIFCHLFFARWAVRMATMIKPCHLYVLWTFLFFVTSHFSLPCLSSSLHSSILFPLFYLSFWASTGDVSVSVNCWCVILLLHVFPPSPPTPAFTMTSVCPLTLASFNCRRFNTPEKLSPILYHFHKKN